MTQRCFGEVCPKWNQCAPGECKERDSSAPAPMLSTPETETPWGTAYCATEEYKRHQREENKRMRDLVDSLATKKQPTEAG